jgi:DNA repair protein RecN (Recombination protein N)
MLDRLRIRQLAVVEDVAVELGPGLNVITGETGAGKSLLVQSINLLVGERADAGLVRDGARAAVVEGEFTLDPAAADRVAAALSEWGVEFDGRGLLVRREVQAGGRSTARVNDTAVTLASLKRLGETLADLHGQHEHQSLLRADAGVEVVDRLGGLAAERRTYAGALAGLREAAADLAKLEETLVSLADRRDWMREALREIEEARLDPAEEEALRDEAARLAHADRLRERVAEAAARLSEGEAAALETLAAAGHAVAQAAALDPSLAEVERALADARIAAAEAARALAGYAAALDADPRELERIEARRETIARLVRRYRRDVAGLLAWRDELAAELAVGEDPEGALAAARERLAGARTRCRAAAAALSAKRRAAAREWSGRLTRELRPLGLPHGRIELVVTPRDGEDAFAATGADEVAILFGANAGEPPRPLQRAASGGELSRVMLALKCALEAQDRVDVLIFDEVDSGIGGAVAQAVGERLRRLARHRQVVCVTHLPLIAALAGCHLAVRKRVAGGRTSVQVEPLEPAERIEEIARMLAGDRVTATTRRQAREMLAPGPVGTPA